MPNIWTASLLSLRSIARDHQAVRCAFVYWEWFTEGDATLEDIARAADVMSTRREAMMIIGEDQSEGTVNGITEIVRPQNDAPYLLPLWIEHYDEYEGPLAGLVPVHGHG